MKKSILIIGSGGFFGNSILDYFSKNKKLSKKINKIILINRSKKNYLDNNLRKNFEIIQIKKDISKAKVLPYADYVIYCVISKSYSKDLNAVKNYIKLAKKYHSRSKIVYTSSGAVYGKQNKSKDIKNELQKIETQSFLTTSKKKYALLKLKNEKLFRELSLANINVSIARCFAFVGKYLPLQSNYVIGNFIQSIIKNKDIVIKSDKKVFRSYMHSDDLAECLLKLVIKRSSNFNIYNIGSDDVIEIHSLAKDLAKKFQLNLVAPIIKDKKKYDMYVPNIKKFRKDFKFNKSLNSKKAIIKTIKEFRK